MTPSCNSIMRAVAGNYPHQVLHPGYWVQEEGEGSYKLKGQGRLPQLRFGLALSRQLNRGLAKGRQGEGQGTPWLPPKRLGGKNWTVWSI